MLKIITKFIFFKILGWKVKGKLPTDIKKYVLIVAPHTSWVDFPIAILINYAIDLRANYVGKASLFKPPFGFIFKALGGAPVERSKSTNMVDSIVNIYNTKKRFILGISPEGTRKKVETWKTGFYYIAKGAKVPILSAALDFENKTLIIKDERFLPTEDKDADIAHLKLFFKGIKGKVPEYS